MQKNIQSITRRVIAVLTAVVMVCVAIPVGCYIKEVKAANTVEPGVKAVYLDGFRNVTINSFADGAGNQLLAGKYTANDAENGFKSYAMRNSFDKTLLSMKVNFTKGSYKERIMVAGNDFAGGFALYSSEDGKNLMFTDIMQPWGDGMTNENYVYTQIFNTTDQVTSFLDNEFLLQISFEYLNNDGDGKFDDLRLGFYFGGQLYNDTPIIIPNCNMEQFGNFLNLYMEPGTESAIEVSALVAENQDLINTTWKDFEKDGVSAKDQQISGTNAGYPYSYLLNKKGVQNVGSTSFEAKVTFSHTGDIIYYGGKDSVWNGIIISPAENGCLEINQVGMGMTELGATNIYLDKNIAGVNSFQEEMVLKITTEFADYNGDGIANDVQLGFYFNGNLYDNQYFYAYNCSSNFGNMINVYAPNGSVTIKSVMPLYLEGFRNVTLSSFADGSGNQLVPGKYTVTNTQNGYKPYMMRDFTQVLSNSFDKTLLSMKVKFAKGSYKERIMVAGNDFAGGFALYSSEDGKNLMFTDIMQPWGDGMTNENYVYTQIFNTTDQVASFLDNEFLLQISFEYLDNDGDSQYNDVQLGFYFNEQLYNNEMIVIPNCNMKQFGSFLNLYLEPGTESEITLSEMVPENESLREITWSDFVNGGIPAEDKTFTGTNNGNPYSYTLNKTGLNNVGATSFETKLTLHDVQNWIYYGGKDNVWNGILFNPRDHETLEVRAIGMGMGENAIFLDKTIAKVDSFLEEFTLKITTEFADYDNDGDAKDVQLGFYFNGKLYNNQYYYAYDCRDNFGDLLNVYTPTGRITMKSAFVSTNPVYLEGFQNVTLSSFVDGNKKQLVAGEYTAAVTENGYKSYVMSDYKNTPVASFHKKLLSMRVMFKEGGYQERIMIAGDKFTDGFALYSSEDGKNLMFTDILQPWGDSMTNENFVYTLGFETTERVTTFLDNEFLLQISFEYLDGNDVRLGFYFNGELYKNETITIPNCNMEQFGNHLSLYLEPDTESTIILNELVPKTPNLLDITWSDFAKGKVAGEDRWFAGTDEGNAYSCQLNKNGLSDISFTSFEAKVSFDNFKNWICYGGKNSSKNGLAIGPTEDGGIEVSQIGLGIDNLLLRFESNKYGINSIEDTVLLKITTEFADYDGDGDTQDVQLGIYVNDYLYNNKYIYAYDCKSNFGNLLNIYTPGGSVTLESVKADISKNTLSLRKDGDNNEDDVIDVRDLVRMKKRMNNNDMSWYNDINIDGKFDKTDLEHLREILCSDSHQPLEDEKTPLSFEFIGGKDVMPIAGYGLWVESDWEDPEKLVGNFITDTYFKKFSDAGINFINYSNADYSTNPQLVLESLRLAEKYNIGMMVTDSRITGNVRQGGTSAYEIEMAIADYRNYAAFSGVYLVDEPQTTYWNLTGVYDKLISDYGALGKTLNQRLNIFNYSNMFGCHGRANMEKYERYVNEYYETLKPQYLSFDYYVFDEGYDVGLFLWTMGLMREKSIRWDIPFWNCIQAGSQWNSTVDRFDSNGYYPTKGQFDWNVNISLAFGAKGIAYFPLVQPIHFAYAESTPWDFKRNGLIGADGSTNVWYDYAKSINKQIAAVDEVLMNADSKGVIVNGTKANKDAELVNCLIESSSYKELKSVSGNAMIGCFDYNGKTALYVVNHDMEQQQEITLRFHGTEAVEYIQGAKKFRTSGNELTLDMAAGEGVLLVIE